MSLSGSIPNFAKPRLLLSIAWHGATVEREALIPVQAPRAAASMGFSKGIADEKNYSTRDVWPNVNPVWQ